MILLSEKYRLEDRIVEFIVVKNEELLRLDVGTIIAYKNSDNVHIFGKFDHAELLSNNRDIKTWAYWQQNGSLRSSLEVEYGKSLKQTSRTVYLVKQSFDSETYTIE